MSRNIKIVVGSVRPGGAGKPVAQWVLEAAQSRGGDFAYELLDLKELNLPWMDEPVPPAAAEAYAMEHTLSWAKTVTETDGFVFVTPEYNHGLSPVLKNAIDYLNQEWKDKPAALVGYGGSGAPYSTAQIRQVMEFVGMDVVKDQVGVNEIWSAFDEDGKLDESKVSGDINALLTDLEGAIG